MTIAFITGNEQKILEARVTCAKYGIIVTQDRAKTHEIQSDDITGVAANKAEQAYAQLRKPLVVTDCGWRIPALNNFPGAYMRYINEWFTPEDFLNLMKDNSDRRVFLVEAAAYHDGQTVHTYTYKTLGTIVDVPRGKAGAPSDKIICLGADAQHTIAEHLDTSSEKVAYDGENVWDVFCKAFVELSDRQKTA